MAAFHVFVEGATDASPDALSRLAQAIAQHYGLSASDLLPRLQKGRFRVKGNTDRATADTYARDLTRLGARVSVEEANAESSGRITPLPFPAARPEPPPPSTTKPPPMSSGLAAAGSAASKPAPAAASGLASGLSAAFSGEQAVADLGALGVGDDSGFALASLDGVDDNRASGGSIGPAASSLPASIGPAAPRTDAPKASGGADKPIDMFAPPDAQDNELSVDLADDEKDFKAAKRASVPPPIADATTPSPATRKSQPIPVVAAAPVTTVPSKLGPLADERTRFAAGVLLAVLLGFIPAHLIAKAKESGADETIDRKVTALQMAADTPDTYATLDRMRADQMSRKEAEHRNAAIIGFAIWALAGGGIAFAWFRKIPWDNFS